MKRKYLPIIALIPIVVSLLCAAGAFAKSPNESMFLYIAGFFYWIGIATGWSLRGIAERNCGEETLEEL